MEPNELEILIRKLRKNGLCIHEVLSTEPKMDKADLKSLDDILSLLNNIDASLIPVQAVFYFDFGIRFAFWQNNGFKFYDDKESLDLSFLQLARIFSPDFELKIWQVNPHFRYRLRIDGVGDRKQVVEASQNLWGTRAKNPNLNWSILTEDRGTELIIPLPIHSVEGQSKPLAAIRTRNYIADSPGKPASYEDCRFVEIKAKS